MCLPLAANLKIFIRLSVETTDLSAFAQIFCLAVGQTGDKNLQVDLFPSRLHDVSSELRRNFLEVAMRSLKNNLINLRYLSTTCFCFMSHF